ncbi:glycosyltransferase family 4 protein [Pseudomonas azerbaijanoccidens]|jgi:Fuc2NAc and GlcNAc transferase|uniref:MraY family glycosyltransferase n=1 Tax=Pseudomonas azerbaijanoccidentalis TaxID=2842347 RepID=UPI00200B1426|nr:glycosyltransferase family 4 protein [Pseudomonas azerbaijanoccidentalis]MCK8664742.1 glycosyltransferase family 4 protein [Pseudomonas azerbaijanoccidentalis]
MSLWWLLPAAGAASFILTAWLRRYALTRSLMDVPNSRSSHSVPTPRGGGVAIVVVFSGVLCAMYAQSLVASSAFFAIAGAGALIAVIGFMDDHGHIDARWRLLGHFAAAIWLLFWIGGLPVVEIGGESFDLGWLGHVLAAFYLVWLLNLYNFMDGIDGIASVEAICVCLGACVLYWLSGATELLRAPLLLAVSVAGFLFWNFPPARIFMGDAGSGFLGIVLGGLSLQASWVSPDLLWGWLILLGVFIVDATFTLFRRLLRGDKVYEAHRSHAYQYASRRFGSHLKVTSVVALINLLWLLPIALGVVRFGLDSSLGLILAYAPLVALAIRFRAGELEAPSVTK